MKIVSPSYKRAGDVIVRKWLPETILAVHDFELGDYEEKEGGALMALPDALRGNMAKVRQFILESVDDGEWVVMLDDDLMKFGFFGGATGHNAHSWLNADDFGELLVHGCDLADQLGIGLWGVNLQDDPKFYREYTPFNFSAPVLGTFCVQKRTPGVDYDFRLGLNEDYDIFLQYLRKYRRVLRLNKYFYKAQHLTLAGGCASYRVMEEEARQAQIMIDKWGSTIVSYDLKKSTNPRLRSPIPGV